MVQAPQPLPAARGRHDAHSSAVRVRPIVLVHGASHDRHTWHLQHAHLDGTGRQVLALDLPGHGDDRDVPLTSIEAMAGWLLARLEACVSAPVHLVGHSMGSLIALEAASRGGERVASLVLVGSTLPMRVAPALLEAARSNPDEARAMVNHWSFAAGDGGPDVDAAKAANLAMMARQPPGVLAIDLAACDGYDGAPAAAAALRCPVRLICGENDRMTPPAGIELLRESLRSGGCEPQTEIIADCGHAIMAEQPARLNEALSRSCRD